MNNKRTIKTSQEIAKLMEVLYLNHKAGCEMPANKVFWVQLPPLTEEEKAAIKASNEERLRAAKEKDYTSDDLFGAEI